MIFFASLASASRSSGKLSQSTTAAARKKFSSFVRLLAMDFHERAAEPCIGVGRGDVVVAGCAILEAILRACPAETVHVADRGLREGMLLGMMRADDLPV